MVNIFNLFLFLFALWIMFMVAGGHISALYVFFGILSAGLISIAAFRLRMIEEKSELLYLSFGFYRHFLKIYLKNFFSGIKLIVNLAFTNKEVDPVVYVAPFAHKNKFNPALLMASYNMTTGLFCIGMKEDELLIHAIDAEHFKKFDLQKACNSLQNVNDDNLV